MTALPIDPRLEPLVDQVEAPEHDDAVDDRLRELVKGIAAEHARLTVPAAAPVTSTADAWRSRLRALEAAIERLARPAAEAGDHVSETLRQVMWLGEQYTTHRQALFASRFGEGAIVERQPSADEAAWAQDVLVEVAAIACDV